MMIRSPPQPLVVYKNERKETHETRKTKTKVPLKRRGIKRLT
jgi:hypothetical protein